MDAKNDWAASLVAVGRAHHANGFMACLVRVGELLLDQPMISHSQLLKALTAEAHALPGYKAIKEPTDA